MLILAGIAIAHPVVLLVHAGAELHLHVVQQPQPVAHVGQRDAVAARQRLVGPAQAAAGC